MRPSAISFLVVACLGWWAAFSAMPGEAASPLTTLEARIVGSRLRVTPETVVVPRNVAGSVLVQVLRGDGAAVTAAEGGLLGGRIEAVLRGPSYPAQRLVAEPGQPLLLPALRLAGDYQLDQVKWVQAGGTEIRATPESIPVKVIDEILVSRVTSRALSSEEIRDKGIVIDSTNFRVVEFEVALVLRGRTFRVNLPVVAPRAQLSTEIIPAAELEERTVEAERINRELARSVELPPEVRAEMPDFSLQPIQFEEVLEGEGEPKGGIPITGLLAIPGNIGFLNQFFSVQLFTENAAPSGSALVVENVQARIRLPLGADGLPARSYELPGDDPLRMARVGSDRLIRTNLAVVLPGPDGVSETADDVRRLGPGETGTAEFLVEGLREGLHLLEIDLEADLLGLAAGVARVKGRAAGSVLVRNANFSMTFSHPETVRTGEPYEAHVTLLNTGDVPANATRVALNRLAISGAVLLGEETVELGDLMPGESATATFRLRSQRTGAVIFSNLTTSDDAVRGRLNLTLGVDSRGVPLSPDVIVYPDWVHALPKLVFDAANRVLGQALSVATAGRLPEGIRRVTRDAVARHGTELAEAGQRIRYGDDPVRVLTDLMLDWEGGRGADAGFEQIVHQSDAGREWRVAIAQALESLDALDAVQRWSSVAPSVAGLGQAWRLAAITASGWTLSVADLQRHVQGTTNAAPTPSYPATRGEWWVGRPGTNVLMQWTAPAASGLEVVLAVFESPGDGQLIRREWRVTAKEGERFQWTPAQPEVVVRVGAAQGAVSGTMEVVHEEPPRVLHVVQDISVVSDRNYSRCPIREYGNWGTVLAVLFSKPMEAASVEVASAYRLAGGDNGARTVKLQPGGRIALLQLHRGVGSFDVRPREYALNIAPVSDPRGQSTESATHSVSMVAAKGVSVRGLVLGLDGNPVAGAPVTLTMTDREGNKCVPVQYRAGQVFTDERGRFDMDFILSDVAFTLGAIDVSRMTEDDARAILKVLLEAESKASDLRPRLEGLMEAEGVRAAMLRAFHTGDLGIAIAAAEGLDRAVYQDLIGQGDARAGSELVVVLRFRGRGSVEGRVTDAQGRPLAGAALNLFPALDSRELGRGMFSDAEGYYRFEGVPLGEFGLEVGTGDGRQGMLSARLLSPGERLRLDASVPDVRTERGSIRGWVTEVDGTPHAAARVVVARQVFGTAATEVVAMVTTDEAGGFHVPSVPARGWEVIALSRDGQRRSEQRTALVVAGSELTLGLTFEPTAVIRGIVRRWDGRVVRGARVGGGDAVVVTGDDGRFELRGVPTGLRTILAGLDGSDAEDGITRTASVQLTVTPGPNDLLELRLPARGRITGRVVDGSGLQPVPSVRVAIPQPGGFLWVNADRNGEFEFNGLGLGAYMVSAPSPPVKPKADELAAQAVASIGEAARGGGGADEAAALVGQLANLYVQGSLGRLTTTPFTPATWGFNTTQLDFDGQTVVANIQYLPSASLSGTVQNAQGVPIGAEVKIRAFGPTKYGGAGMIEIGPMASHPASGEWSARGFLVGPFTAVASSPLLVGEALVTGVLSQESPVRTNVVLKFPPQRELTGRLVGLVSDADGHAVSNAAVHIDFTSDYVISSDAEGRFDTQLRLPARRYSVVATNLADGAVGRVSLDLIGGLTNFVHVNLLGRGGLRVTVRNARGETVPGAVVTARRYEFPSSDGESAVTGTDGVAELGGLWEGEWTVEVQALDGVARNRGIKPATVMRNLTGDVQVMLGATATLAGVFHELESGRPVQGAQVTVRFDGRMGAVAATAPTGADGAFSVQGLPLGRYILVARHPVTGRLATAPAQLSVGDGNLRVTLVETPLGRVEGVVVRDGLAGGQSGVEMTFQDGLGLEPPRKVTSGSSGEFVFSGVPLGPFSVAAFDPLRGSGSSVRGAFAAGATVAQAQVTLLGTGSVVVQVWEPDGVTPAAQATVRARVDRAELVVDTDADGRATLAGLNLGNIAMTVSSRRPGERASQVQSQVAVMQAGSLTEASVTLPGVGRLRGRVLTSAGQPAAGARVTYASDSSSWPAVSRETVSESDGTFVLEDLPLTSWTVRVVSGALAAQATGRHQAAGELLDIDLRLGASGGARGLVQDAQGFELRDVEVAFFFLSQAGQPAFARARADGVGAFRVDGLPVETEIRGRVEIPAIDGVRTFVFGVPSAGGEVDLGILRLDQAPPELVSLEPRQGAAAVSEEVVLRLDFSEPLRAASVRTNGLVLSSAEGIVPVTWQLEDGQQGTASRLVGRLSQRLRSAGKYVLAVSGADRVDASGLPVSLGPEDLESRPLPRTELIGFTVRDYEPPRVLVTSPAPDERDVEPRAPVRWEFDELIQTNRVQARLTQAGVLVPASVDLSADGRVLVLVPAAPLAADREYAVRLFGVTDLAGNEAPEAGFTFTTLDTRGPTLAVVRLREGQRPVANASVTLEGILETPEPGAAVRWTRNGVEVGISTNGPVHTFAVRLPAEGTVRITATAVDRVGNAGEARVLELQVGPNERPTLAIARTEPPSGPLETGRRFGFSLVARDDATVSNIRVEGKGASPFVRELRFPPNGVATNVVVLLPEMTLVEGSLEVTAVAVDDSGALSTPARLQYTLRDATSPKVALDAPLDREVLDPRTPLVLGARVTENGRSVVWTVRISGTRSMERVVSWNIVPGIEQRTNLVVNLSDWLEGGILRLSSSVRDAAGNTVEESRQYTVKSVTGPRLVRVAAADAGNVWEYPSDQAISVWSSLILNFDRALAREALSTNLLQVSTRSGRVPPYHLELGSSYVQVHFSGPSLEPGDTVALRLLPGWVGADGIPVTQADGSDLPAAGLVREFDVASVTGVSVRSGDPIVPGQTFLMEVVHEPAPWSWRLLIEGGTERLWQPQSARTGFEVTVATNAAQVRIQPESLRSGREARRLPEVQMEVRSRDADDDGDGLPNGWEADRSRVGGVDRFNPFESADAARDEDSDGLANLEEFRLGTDPFLVDSDADGMTDGRESRDGGCPSPLDADSDDDGIRDGADLAPCSAGEGIAVSPLQWSVPEGAASTNVLVVTGTGLSPLSIDFAPGVPPPAFVTWAEYVSFGTNPISRRLVVRPSFDDAGRYDLVLQVVARRAVGVVTSNIVMTLIVEDRSNVRFTRWARAADGEWNEPGNWTAGLPGLGTNAVVDLPGTYTVRVAGNVSAESLLVGTGSGSARQTVLVDSGTLDLNGASRVQQGGVMVIRRFGRVHGPGSLRVDGLLRLEDGRKEGAGLVSIGTGGRMEVEDGISLRESSMGSPLENGGSVVIGMSNSLALVSSGFTNLAGGVVLQTGGVVRGSFRERVENRGQWFVESGRIPAMQNFALRQLGDLEVRRGDLELWNLQLETGADSSHRGPGRLLLDGVSGVLRVPFAFQQGAVIRGGVLTNEVTQRWGTLKLAGSTIHGNGALIVTQRCEVASASLLGSGPVVIEPQALLRLHPFRFASVERPLEISGHLELGTNASLATRTWTVDAGASVEIQDGVIWRAYDAAVSGGQLSGVLVKRGSGTATVTGFPVVQRGQVLVEGGELRLFTRLENTGRLEAAAGAALELQDSANHLPGSYLGGRGSIRMTGGTHELAGTCEPLGAWSLRSSTVRVRQAISVPMNWSSMASQVEFDVAPVFESLSINQGAWQSAGGLRVERDANLNGMVWRGPGVWEVGTNGILTIGNSGVGFEAGMRMRGRAEVASDASLRLTGARWENDGEWRLLGGATFQGVGVTTNDFINRGVFHIGTNALRFSSVGFSALGEQRLQPVQVTFDGGTNAGVWRMPEGGRTVFNADFVHLPGSELGGAGALEFVRGAQRVLGRMTGTGPMSFLGGDVVFAQAFTNQARTRVMGGSVQLAGTNQWRELELVRGTLGVPGDLRITREFLWTGGEVGGAGRVSLDETSSSRVSGFGGQILGTTLQVSGSLSITNSTRVQFRDGVLHILPTGIHEMGQSVSYWQLSGAGGRLINEGLVRKSGAEVLDIDLLVEGAGRWELGAGRLDLGNSVSLGGVWSIGEAATLRFEGATNRWRPDLHWEGNGQMEFPRNSTLILESDVDLGALRVGFNAPVQVLGEYALRTGAAGSVAFRGSTASMEGALEVAGRMEVGASTVVRIDDRLALGEGARLVNAGRRDGQGRSNVRVREFSNSGATIEGLSPDVIPPSTPLRWVPHPGVDSMRARLAAVGLGEGDAVGSWMWWSPTGVEGVVQISRDLKTWEDAGPFPQADPRGWREIPWEATGEGALFLRVRETEW